MVDARRRELHYYKDEEGKTPFRDWLHALPDTIARARIRIRLDRVEDGNFGDHRSVGEGVVELKLHFGPGYRIYIGFAGPKVILLLCGGDKKTQAKDIRVAKRYWWDYKMGGSSHGK